MEKYTVPNIPTDLDDEYASHLTTIVKIIGKVNENPEPSVTILKITEIYRQKEHHKIRNSEHAQIYIKYVDLLRKEVSSV